MEARVADHPRSGATPWLALLVGGLIVALAVLGYYLYSSAGRMEPKLPAAINIDINLPKAPPIPDAPRLPDAPIPVPK